MFRKLASFDSATSASTFLRERPIPTASIGFLPIDCLYWLLKYRIQFFFKSSAFLRNFSTGIEIQHPFIQSEYNIRNLTIQDSLITYSTHLAMKQKNRKLSRWPVTGDPSLCEAVAVGLLNWKADWATSDTAKPARKMRADTRPSSRSRLEGCHAYPLTAEYSYIFGAFRDSIQAKSEITSATVL